MFRSVESFRCDLDIIILHSRISLPYRMLTEATIGVHRIDIERLHLARLPMSKTQPVKSKRIENWGQVIVLCIRLHLNRVGVQAISVLDLEPIRSFLNMASKELLSRLFTLRYNLKRLDCPLVRSYAN